MVPLYPQSTNMMILIYGTLKPIGLPSVCPEEACSETLSRPSIAGPWGAKQGYAIGSLYIPRPIQRMAVPGSAHGAHADALPQKTAITSYAMLPAQAAGLPLHGRWIGRSPYRCSKPAPVENGLCFHCLPVDARGYPARQRVWMWHPTRPMNSPEEVSKHSSAADQNKAPTNIAPCRGCLWPSSGAASNAMHICRHG
jgi:hypothetical protein